MLKTIEAGANFLTVVTRRVLLNCMERALAIDRNWILDNLNINVLIINNKKA